MGMTLSTLFDFGGTREVDAVFAELVLFPSDELEIQFAGRYEDYGDGVDSFDPKIGVLWTPTDGVFIRASAGTSFKIAGEVQSFGNTATGCANCVLNGDDVDARGARVGNPTLKPEEGESFTAGITWDVTDNFSMEFNYYSIEFTNLVRAEDGAVTLDNDVADGFIDDPRRVELADQLGGYCTDYVSRPRLREAVRKDFEDVLLPEKRESLWEIEQIIQVVRCPLFLYSFESLRELFVDSLIATQCVARPTDAPIFSPALCLTLGRDHR